jgi:hypothetical protein
MKYEDIDLNDHRNPHVSEINGVLMDTRFLGNRIKGTLAHWMKDNLHVCHYCPECYTISRTGYEHEKHFARRFHRQATDRNKKRVKRT